MFCFEFVFQASHKKRQQHRHRHNKKNWKFPSTETWFQESATARSQSAHSLPCFLTIRNQKQHASMDTRILIFNLIQNLKISGECRSSFPVCSQFEKDSASRWCLGRWEVTNSFWRRCHNWKDEFWNYLSQVCLSTGGREAKSSSGAGRGEK